MFTSVHVRVPHVSVCLSGVPEPARSVSSGSLRAHAELLEQRLQAPPIVRLHPLVSHRGRHEHGLKLETKKRGGGGHLVCLSLLLNSGMVWWRVSQGGWDAHFYILYLFFFFGGWGAETPLVRFYFHLRLQ